MRVAGTVTVDLAALDPDGWTNPHAVDRPIQEVTYAPPGADVVFIVRRGQHPPLHGIAWLKEHGQHLGSVTVQSADPDTIRRWIDALRPTPKSSDHLVSTGAARP